MYEARPSLYQSSMLNPDAKPAQDARTPRQSGRQRSRSGTGLLSKLSFLRLPTIIGSPNDKGNSGDDGNLDIDDLEDISDGQPVDPRRALELDRPEILDLPESYLKRTRKRAGSLRKTALLGTRKLLNEQRLSQLKVEQSSDPSSEANAAQTPQVDGAAGEAGEGGYRVSQVETSGIPVASRASNGQSQDLVGIAKGAVYVSQQAQPSSSSRPSTSSSRASELGGLSEDVVSILSRRSTSSTIPSTLSGVSSRGEKRNRKYGRKSSPLALPPQGPEPPVHGYETTARFGALILAVTWLIFVIGMGSCLDVWSWAWDVGETPYAPPELEDDETLPITGYYPALMVCTAVTSWVWVISAWIGMKYFKHARGVVTD